MDFVIDAMRALSPPALIAGAIGIGAIGAVNSWLALTPSVGKFRALNAAAAGLGAAALAALIAIGLGA